MSLDSLPLLGRGQLWVHASGRSEFKTTFALQQALRVAGQGGRVVAFSYELPCQQLYERVLHCHYASKGFDDQRGAELDFIRHCPKFHFFSGDFESTACQFSVRYNADLLVLDGITFRSGSNPLHWAAEFAKESNVPVLATMQTTRFARDLALLAGGSYRATDIQMGAMSVADIITYSTLVEDRVIIGCLKNRCTNPFPTFSVGFNGPFLT